MKLKLLNWIVAAYLLLVVPAGASEWGCKVMLCLANPEGWASVSDCVPPVTAYFACKSGWFFSCIRPTCPEAGSGMIDDKDSWKAILSKIKNHPELKLSPIPLAG